MAGTVLIVTMGVDYLAPARMPYELRRAGLRVALVAPSEALAMRTAHVDYRGSFPGNVTLYEWVLTIAAAVRGVAPVLILPGDDITLRTLMQLVLAPPADLVPILDTRLVALIQESLGAAIHWIDAIDKTRLYECARRAGVAVADGGVAVTPSDAHAIATRVGYPVIVRRDYGTAGAGSAKCGNAGEIRAAMCDPTRHEAWRPSGVPRFLVQRWIDGPILNRASLAWQGQEIAGFTRSRLETHPAPFGPASVVEFVGVPAIAEATRALFSRLGMHGYAGTQFLVDPDSGQALLVEINRRMLPATHSGSRVGIDLAVALARLLAGEHWDGPRDLPAGPGTRLALFPQEWYRDPGSHWLRELPCDVPWHDTPLLTAMVKAVVPGSGAVNAR